MKEQYTEHRGGNDGPKSKDQNSGMRENYHLS